MGSVGWWQGRGFEGYILKLPLHRILICLTISLWIGTLITSWFSGRTLKIQKTKWLLGQIHPDHTLPQASSFLPCQGCPADGTLCVGKGLGGQNGVRGRGDIAGTQSWKEFRVWQGKIRNQMLNDRFLPYPLFPSDGSEMCFLWPPHEVLWMEQPVATTIVYLSVASPSFPLYFTVPHTSSPDQIPWELGFCFPLYILGSQAKHTHQKGGKDWKNKTLNLNFAYLGVFYVHGGKDLFPF